MKIYLIIKLCKKSLINFESNLIKNSEMKDFDNLLKEEDISEQFRLIYDIYEQMNKKNDITRFIYNKPNNKYYRKIEKYNNIINRKDDSSISLSYKEENSYLESSGYKYINNEYSNDNYSRNKTNNIKIYSMINLIKKNDILKEDNSNKKFRHNKIFNSNEEEKQNFHNNYNHYDYINQKKDEGIPKIIAVENNYEDKIMEKKSQISIDKNNYDKNKGLSESIIIIGNNKKRKLASVGKYGQLENNLKNKIQQRIPIENKEKNYIYNNSDKPKGLYNLGLSCYMNSLLQCLYYIPELREYFIKEDNFNDKQPVCKALSEVMYKLKYSENDNIEAKMFKKIMG